MIFGTAALAASIICLTFIAICNSSNRCASGCATIVSANQHEKYRGNKKHVGHSDALLLRKDEAQVGSLTAAPVTDPRGS